MPQPVITPMRRFTRAELLVLVLIPALYSVLIDHFRTYNIDNPWYASYTYAWWNGHTPTDLFMQQTFPSGMGGVEAFGKLAAAVQGIVMNVVGWRSAHFEWLSTIFVSVSLFVFADTARRVGRSRNFVLAYVTVIGLSEQFLFAAEQARYEYVTLLLFALALWVGTLRQFAFSALLGALCMEVQPAGCLPYLATVVFLLCLKHDSVKTRGRILRIAAGSFLALLVYFALHPYIFNTTQRVLHGGYAAVKGLPGGFLAGYFLESKRHLAELPIVVAAIVLAARGRTHIFREWAAIAFAVSIVLSALLRWDNPRYVALIMPFVAWFLVDAFAEQNWKWIVAGTAFIFLPQYAYRASVSMRHPDFTSAEEDQVSAAVNRAAAHLGKRPEDLRVRGNHWLWFAHPQNFVALDVRTLLPGKPHIADVVLCLDGKLDPVLKQFSSEVRCGDLENLPPPFETLSLWPGVVKVIASPGMNLHYQWPDDWLRASPSTMN